MTERIEDEDAIRDGQSSIQVLLIEDDEDDYWLTREYFDDFEQPDRYDLEWVDTYDEGLQSLRRGNHDVCLLDYRLGARDGVELLRQVLNEDCALPIIMLTGLGSRTVDRTAMRHGAADYLVKTEITPTLLERSIRYSLERHRFTQQQRELAAENARLYQQAQQALEIREEIHRIVVHDLRNPLNTMGLALQLMERHVDHDADAEDFRRQLQTQRICISKMKRLIQDLLDAARIEDGKISLSRGVYRPRQLVESTVEQHRIQAEDRSIELTVDVADDLPRVDVDNNRIEQVFANLIGNALKFTPEGGIIELSVHGDDGAVRFAVRDTGRGIADDQLPHLFDRFWQAEEGSGDGTGLGLAICKGIIDAHDGQIWVDSTEGEGTTFFFTIPTAEACEPTM